MNKLTSFLVDEQHDDIIETTNHFVAFDYLLQTVEEPLSEGLIKAYHRILKTGTADAQRPYFNVGDYKKLANCTITGVFRSSNILQVSWSEPCSQLRMSMRHG